MPRELIATDVRTPEFKDYDDGPLPPGHILVQVEFGSPKHGTELAEYRGVQPAEFPMPLGNTCVGTVVEIAPDVENCSLGDRVAGRGNLRETHIWPRSSVRFLNSRMTPKEAVCYDPAQFALGGVRDGQVRVGDNVAVFGLGAIGQMAAQLCSIAGAGIVATIDPIAIRREAALSAGADFSFDPTVSSVGQKLLEITDGRGIDVAIETSGSYRALHAAIDGLSWGGTVAYVGRSEECIGGLNFGEKAHYTIPNIIFSRANSDPQREHPRWDWARFQNTCWTLLSDGRLHCEDIIYPIVGFENAVTAYREIDEFPERSIKLGVEFK